MSETNTTVRNRSFMLTEAMILDAAKRFYAREKRWPSVVAGDATQDFGFPYTWVAVDGALRAGLHGLAGGKTLTALLPARAKAKDRRGRDRLTEALIVWGVHSYRARTGRWPSCVSGNARPDLGFDYTWNAVEQSLRYGASRLPGGSSIRRLIAAHFATDGTLLPHTTALLEQGAQECARGPTRARRARRKTRGKNNPKKKAMSMDKVKADV